MRLKKLWVYLGLLVGIAGLWLTFEWVFPKNGEEAKSPPLFKALEAAKIREIKWEKGEARIRLVHDRTWTIKAPITGAVDAQVLADVLQGLSELRPERRLTGNKIDLKDFGLEPSPLKIVFLNQDRWHEIHVGRKTAVGTAYYVMISTSPDLFLISDYQIRSLDRTLFDLRDKKIFSFSLDQVRFLSMGLKNKKFIMEKDSKGWYWKDRPGYRLNPGKVNTFISDLLRLRAVGFAESGLKNPKWGLKDPPYELILRPDGTGPEEVLKIGLEMPSKGLCGWSSIQKEVLFLEPSILKKIPQGLEDWEEKAFPPLPKKGPND